MGTNYIAPIWRMPENANKDKLSNYSLEFNGQTNGTHIQVDDFTSLSGKSNFSISVWLKASAVPAVGSGTTFQGNILNLTTSGVNSSTINVVIFRTSTSPNVYRLDVEVGSIAFRANISDPTTDWNNFIIAYNSNEPAAIDRCKVYQNGTQVTNTLAGNVQPVATADTLSIGLKHTKTQWFDHFFGSMSQLAIFDYTLTDGTNGTVDQISYLNGLNNPMAITGGKPIAYYPLGDNSNPNAIAGYPNISVGADSVFNFNGSDLISTGTTLSDLSITTSFSISLWVNISTNGIYDTIIGAPTAYATWNTGFGIILNSSGIRFWVEQWDGANQFVETSSLNNGQWYHIVATFDTTNGLKLYVNAATPTTATGTTIDGLTNEIFIGSSGTNVTYGLFGDLSNIQIWNTELSSSDINTLYNNGQPLMTGTQPQEANLQAWYKLNQSANWDLFGQSKWTISDSASPYTKSFSLDSANSPADYFTTNSGPRGMTTNVGTYSCWINLNSVAGTQVFMDVAGFASREFLVLQIRNNNALQMQMRSWSVQMSWDSVTTTPFEVGKWYHVVAVGDGANIKMYINGEEISTYIAAGSYRWWSNFNTNIAHNGGNRINLGAGVYPTRHSPLNGRISNAQIWNTNLSSSQIETLYNNGKPLQGTQPAQTNLLAWYKLNQDSTWTNYNYWNNLLVNKWSSKNSAITTTPPTESFGFSGSAQDGDYEGWEVTNKSISGSLLLSFWYKTTGDNVFTWTFNNDGSGNTNAGHARMQGNGYIYFFSPNASNYFYRPSVNISDYNWHNLIIYIPNGSPTYDANDINLWLDGVELGKPTIVGSTTWDAFTEIIGMNRNTSATNNGVGTQWSNWALFENVTPSDSVIDTIFNGGTPGDISSLNPSIWYKLDNTDTTFATTGSKATALSITDSSSNNNDATGPYDYDAAVNSRPVLINGNVENAIAGYYMDGSELVDFSVSTLNGKSSGMNTTNLVTSNISRTQPYSNYSFNLDGATNDYINSTDNNIFSFGDGTNDSPFSMSAWIKTTVGTARGIISKWGTSGTSGYEWIFWIVGPNKIRVNLNDNINTVYQTAQGNTSVNTGEWVHALVTYDGRGGDGSTGANTANQGIKIYVNGVEDTPYSYLNGGGYVAMHNTARIVQLGGYNNAGQFDGQISNAAIFNRVLNEDEILNIYNNGITQDLQTPSTFSNNIVAWWPMDQHSSYFDGTNWVVRELENGQDGTGVNTNNIEDMVGNAPGSDANGTGNNLTIEDLGGNMYNSNKNAYSINMADYASGVTNPANSGRSTDTP